MTHIKRCYNVLYNLTPIPSTGKLVYTHYMASHRTMNLATSIAGHSILLAALYSLILAESTQAIPFYQFSLYAILTAVVLMEVRVRMGFRTKRGSIFYLHLICAVPFLISLFILAFYARPVWLLYCFNCLLAILSLAGFTLLRRTMSVRTLYR